MIHPSKVTLTARAKIEATVRVEGTPTPPPVIGNIHVQCSSAQAFAEILNYLVHADEAIIGIQTAISALQMTNRLPDLRKLQEAHFRLTGWHFPSATTPATLDNPQKEVIIPAKETP